MNRSDEQCTLWKIARSLGLLSQHNDSDLLCVFFVGAEKYTHYVETVHPWWYAFCLLQTCHLFRGRRHYLWVATAWQAVSAMIIIPYHKRGGRGVNGVGVGWIWNWARPIHTTRLHKGRVACYVTALYPFGIHKTRYVLLISHICSDRKNAVLGHT